MIEEVAIAKIADIVFEKYRKMKDESENKITTVRFQPEYFTKSIIDDTTTTKTEFDMNYPDLVFEMPYSNSECFLRELSIIPDENFKTKGKVRIIVNDREIFETVKFGNLKNVLESLSIYRGGIPISKHTQHAVKIFIISEDATPVNLTVSVLFGVV